jgi:hypothetical protein
MNATKSVRVKFLRPIKWDGELRAVGFVASLPSDLAASLGRHRAVALVKEAEEGREVGQRSSVEPIPSPRTTTPGKKSAPAKAPERKV